MTTMDIPHDKICQTCQQAAIYNLAARTDGVAAVFRYCEITQRGLFVRSFDGEVDATDVSEPGKREKLEAICLEYWNRWLETAEIKSAEIEFSAHFGRTH